MYSQFSTSMREYIINGNATAGIQCFLAIPLIWRNCPVPSRFAVLSRINLKNSNLVLVLPGFRSLLPVSNGCLDDY